MSDQSLTETIKAAMKAAMKPDHLEAGCFERSQDDALIGNGRGWPALQRRAHRPGRTTALNLLAGREIDNVNVEQVLIGQRVLFRDLTFRRSFVGGNQLRFVVVELA